MMYLSSDLSMHAFWTFLDVSHACCAQDILPECHKEDNGRTWRTEKELDIKDVQSAKEMAEGSEAGDGWAVVRCQKLVCSWLEQC